MITLYEKGADIVDEATGEVVGYETTSVNFPDFFYEWSGIKYHWDQKTLEYNGKTYFKSASAIDSADSLLLGNWENMIGHRIDSVYYRGVEQGNPSGNTDNVMREEYIDDKGNLRYYRTFAWNDADNCVSRQLFRAVENKNKEEEHKTDDIEEQQSDKEVPVELTLKYFEGYGVSIVNGTHIASIIEEEGTYLFAQDIYTPAPTPTTESTESTEPETTEPANTTEGDPTEGDLTDPSDLTDTTDPSEADPTTTDEPQEPSQPAVPTISDTIEIEDNVTKISITLANREWAITAYCLDAENKALGEYGFWTENAITIENANKEIKRLVVCAKYGDADDEPQPEPTEPTEPTTEPTEPTEGDTTEGDLTDPTVPTDPTEPDPTDPDPTEPEPAPDTDPTHIGLTITLTKIIKQ